MRVDQPPGGEAVARFKTTVSEPTDDALLSALEAVCDLLGLVEEAVKRSERVDAVTSGEADSWNQFVVDSASWMNALARVRGVVVRSMMRLREGCAANTKVVSHAESLVETGRASFEAMQRVLSQAASRASAPAGKHPSASDALLLRLRAVDDILCQQCRELDGFNSIFDHTFDVVRRLFVKACPVASSLASSERLPPGRQRSPGRILVLVPGRDPELCIPRDDKVVRTLVHVANVRNARVASAVVSSPGIGKSHLAWDVVNALESLDSPRYADAAMVSGVPEWSDARDELQGTRPCIITFNSSSLWGRLDVKLLYFNLSSQPEAAYLPLYLRVLWCLRCADNLGWAEFAQMVIQRLEAGTTTADVIIAEAQAALNEQPTLVIVEELNKVCGVWPESASRSPIDALLERDDLAKVASLPKVDKPQDVEDSDVQLNSAVSTSILDVYRHEVCGWTGLSTACVSVLFTAVHFGLIFDELKGRLSPEQKRIVDALITRVGEIVDPVLLEDCQTRLTSLSNKRRGSPFFVLSAVRLGFMDMKQLAKVYFLPLFESRWLMLAGLPRKGTFDVPSEVSARALARLSGGHPRSAGFLRQQLKAASPGAVWTEVVQPAWEALAQDEDTEALLADLLLTSVVIVAALHHCTVDGAKQVVDGGLAPTWEALVSRNVLTVSNVSSLGTYKNPCMPPLYLLAFLELWEPNKEKLAERPGTGELYTNLDGIFSALAVVCGSRSSQGSPGYMWEYTALYADVALTRVRAAAQKWGPGSSGLKLPHDYAAVTLLQLYPGATKFYTKCRQRLLNEQLYNALNAVEVNEDAAANAIASILARPPSELVSTVFKCSPGQVGFDSIKFLAPAGSSESPNKADLVAVVKSNKFTGLAAGSFNIKQHVRKALRLVKKAFGSDWKEWSQRVVLVVESNLRGAKDPDKLLSAAQSSKVIIICEENHLDVYGRAISGFMADGPTLYGASLVKRERSGWT